MRYYDMTIGYTVSLNLVVLRTFSMPVKRRHPSRETGTTVAQLGRLPYDYGFFHHPNAWKLPQVSWVSFVEAHTVPRIDIFQGTTTTTPAGMTPALRSYPPTSSPTHAYST